MSKNNYVSFKRHVSEHPDNTDFMMHTHKDQFEILLFIEGDAEFRVEGSVYQLKPYDTVIAAENEMHRIIHHTDTKYERFIFMINSDFFVKNDCSECAGLIFDRPLGVGNLIPYSITKNTHYLECIDRLIEYLEDEEANSVVIKCVITEILYILNKCSISNQYQANYSNKYINDVISYINEHLTEDITLENLSNHFFVNKSYLCRIFKKHTGYTLNRYINHKRILKVRELCSKKMSITDASVEAGFGNYSNFYKIYLKEIGVSPRKDLKK